MLLECNALTGSGFLNYDGDALTDSGSFRCDALMGPGSLDCDALTGSDSMKCNALTSSGFLECNAVLIWLSTNALMDATFSNLVQYYHSTSSLRSSHRPTTLQQLGAVICRSHKQSLSRHPPHTSNDHRGKISTSNTEKVLFDLTK